MSGSQKRLLALSAVFGAIVIASLGLLALNVSDYMGLLNSMEKVEVYLDSIVITPEDEEYDIYVTIRIRNPTNYDRLEFSSLNLQLYLLGEGDEAYVGTTAYAPPGDTRIDPHGELLCPSRLSIKKTGGVLIEDPGSLELRWRVRCVVHFSTPIRRYYQTYSFQETSSFSTE